MIRMFRNSPAFASLAEVFLWAEREHVSPDRLVVSRGPDGTYRACGEVRR